LIGGAVPIELVEVVDVRSHQEICAIEKDTAGGAVI
jgi:hypothetical protein